MHGERVKNTACVCPIQMSLLYSLVMMIILIIIIIIMMIIIIIILYS